MAKAADTIDNYLKLQEKIRGGNLSPIYLLHGTEPFFIDSLSDLIQNTALPEAERSFNQSVIYGKELKINDLMGMARRYPMMSKYQVIILKEAQDLKEWDKFEAYANQPLDSTILVINFRNAKFDMRLKTGKALSKYEVFLSEPLRDYQLKLWIPQFVKNRGRTIDAPAVERLIDLLGTELGVIHNEIEKLLLTVKEDFIKVAHVDTNVGMNRTYNVFELQNALGYKNFNKAIQIAHHMAANIERGELLMMTPVLFKFFSKVLQVHSAGTGSEYELASALGVNAFFVKDYTAAARNYRPVDLERVINHIKLLDLRLKGIHRGSAEDGDLLIETIVNILKN
ncbi:MAG: DNA polymerase III subunit delta [Bacteroidia bacterium]|nr:DNA polymerase III subunit delta [Bacteroidia bacterium]